MADKQEGGMELLDDEAIAAGLGRLAGWERDGKAITKTYKRKGFRGAIAFVNAVADLAEEANHHPDIDIRWNRVRLTLSTHSAGGLTSKDLELAERIEAAASEP